MMEREGPAYTCPTPTCGIQIAQSNVPVDVSLNQYEFRDAYNIIITDGNLVNIGNFMERGFAVSRINCSQFLGWRDEEEDGLFRFRYDRVVPPPPPANPPPHPANLQDNQTLSKRNVSAAPIDKLPPDLLGTIISFLPTRFAVQTSVLSKKWKDLWRQSTSCCLIYSGNDKRAGGVTYTLHRLETTLSTFHLIVDDVPRRQNDVDEWVYRAMELKAENMSIRFIGGDHDHRLWDDFYLNDNLKELVLQLENSYMHPKKEWDVKWPMLTSLSLCCPYITQDILDHLLGGCPRLRTLAIDRCGGQLADFDLRKAPTVTRFDLRCDYFEPKPEIMKIDAPEIRYLKLYFDSPCLLVNVQSLEEAVLNSYNLQSWVTHDSLTAIMEKLQRVRKFTFGSEFLMMLSLAHDRRLPSPTFKVEELTLETEILPSVLPGIRRILQNSPILKKVNIDVVGKDGDSKRVLSLIWLLLGDSTSLDTLVFRLGDFLEESEFLTLAMMTRRKFGKVTVLVKRSRARMSFTSIFDDDLGCSQHGNHSSMMF